MSRPAWRRHAAPADCARAGRRSRLHRVAVPQLAADDTLNEWAYGVTMLPSSACVMMPAYDGGVCGKPPGGATGSVGGTRRAPWKRMSGRPRCVRRTGSRASSTGRTAPSLSKLVASAVADAVVDDGVSAADDELVVAGELAPEALVRVRRPRRREAAARSCSCPTCSSRACCWRGRPGRTAPSAPRWWTSPPPSARGVGRTSLRG